MTKKCLIIGGGPAGCAAAHALELNAPNIDVIMIEKSNFLGAGVRTLFWGGHPYTFGPRHFLTKQKKIYDFLNKFLPLRDCSEHKFITYNEQDNQFYNMPLSYDDIEVMPDKAKILKELEATKNNKIEPRN